VTDGPEPPWRDLGKNGPVSDADTAGPPARGPKAVTAGLLFALAVQNAVPPFATDMYSPAFPQVAAGLDTASAAVGLTLTSFFVGMALGQVVGGAASDQVGRRRPILAGAVVCTLGGVACAVAPSIGVLVVARAFQGFGGGVAAAAGRAVLVDRAEGDQLARAMTLLMTIGGFAPMVAPILGGVIASVAPWRAVFWALAGFGLLMAASAWCLIPESLAPERRTSGGLTRFVTGVGSVVRVRPFLGYLAVSCCSGMATFAYIAESAYVLEEMAGLSPFVFSLFFAGNALVGVLLGFLNARLVGRFRPRALIRFGLAGGTAGVALLAVDVFVLGTPLWPTCAGFLILLGTQSFVFGNASALALAHVRHAAGVASALTGLIQSLANSFVAPVASSGGGVTAAPMVWVMIVGSATAWLAYALMGRARPD